LEVALTERAISLWRDDAAPLFLNCERRREFRVKLAWDILGASSDAIAELIGDRLALVVTTPTVDHLYGTAFRDVLHRNGCRAGIEILPLREGTKTLDSVTRIAGLARRHAIDRKGVLVAFGGGVCSDAVGLAASMIRRGIAHVRIPTTLVGQIDAAIGLKGGVNFGSAKNYLGCFYPPDGVLVDRGFLASLPRSATAQGLAEIIKIALMCDGGLFALLEHEGERLLEERLAGRDPDSEWVVERSIALMLRELGSNPYEDRTLARLVDFGHTFSPEIEATSAYAIPHGEAVAIDMALCALIAADLGFCSEEAATRIVRLIQRLDLPIFTHLLDVDLCRRALASTVRHRGGALNLVLPRRIGVADFLREREKLPDAVLVRCLSRLSDLAAEGAP
jgi:3-dehydroquinate synthase